MSYLENVQRAIDFIESNLDSDLSLSQISTEADMSQWHFQRIFKALTNETLKGYIRSRRFSVAMDELVNTQSNILTIALKAGFETQESFTRAFKKHFNMTPSEFRKRNNRKLFLQKLRLDQDYLQHIRSNISLTPEIVLEQPRKFIGLRTRFYSVDSDKNNIAEKLPPLWESILARVDEIPNLISGVGYGIISQTETKTDHLDYYAVFEIFDTVEQADLPDQMLLVELPATRYARFAHKGWVSALDETVNYIYSNWLLNSSARHSYQPDIEIYGDGYDPQSPDSLIHYSIPLANTIT